MAIYEENLATLNSGYSKDDDVLTWITKNDVASSVELGGIANPDYNLLIEHGVAENITEDQRYSSNPLGVFNRYYKVYPGDESSGIYNYIFMVRPDLNMDYCMKVDPYYANLWLQDPDIVLSLTQSVGNTIMQYQEASRMPAHHWISWLTPRVTSYSVPDITLKTYDFEQPYTNYHSGYAGNMNDSLSGTQLDVQFRDTKDMKILKFFDAWVRYINGVNTGILSPKLKYVTSRITDGAVILDYCTSIYQIGVLADAREIVYFHKTTGLFPTSVPLSINSHIGTPNTDTTISVQFAGGFPEAFEPAILADFNYNSGLNKLAAVNLETNFSAPLVGAPIITWNSRYKKYFLRWSTI